MTRWDILLGVSSTFLLSQNIRISLSGFLVEVFSSFLLIAINYTIFLFIILLDKLHALGARPVIEAIYWNLPLCISVLHESFNYILQMDVIIGVVNVTLMEIVYLSVRVDSLTGYKFFILAFLNFVFAHSFRIISCEVFNKVYKSNLGRGMHSLSPFDCP